ncbi:hypothetical protein BH09PAT2_BH09PAT2_04950 [soil metagenome]
MKPILTKTALFVLFLCVMAISLYGTLTTDTIPSRAVGAMQIAPFDTGLALYQGYRGEYYPISPFNDYTLTKEATRSAYISVEAIQNKNYTSTYKHSHLGDLVQSLASYFIDIKPSISFTAQRYQIGYTATVDKNTTIIHRKTHDIYGWSNPNTQAMTIPYKGADFVFDATGKIHQYHLPKELSEFERIYGIHLTQNLQELKVPLKNAPVIIVNPRLSAAIVIRPQDGQSLFVDRNAKLITIEQPISNKTGDYEMDMQLEVYTEPHEALNSL